MKALDLVKVSLKVFLKKHSLFSRLKPTFRFFGILRSSCISPASTILCSARFNSAKTQRSAFSELRWAANLLFVCRSCLRLASRGAAGYISTWGLIELRLLPRSWCFERRSCLDKTRVAIRGYDLRDDLGCVRAPKRETLRGLPCSSWRSQ